MRARNRCGGIRNINGEIPSGIDLRLVCRERAVERVAGVVLEIHREDDLAFPLRFHNSNLPLDRR